MTDATVTGPARKEGPLMEGPPAIRRTRRNKKAAISSNDEGTQSPEIPSMHEDTGGTESLIDLTHARNFPMNERRSSVHDLTSPFDLVESSSELVDSPVPRALQNLDMSESPILRSELERIEARLSEIRKLELEIEARIAATIAEDQKRLRELMEDRMGLEKLAALARQVLSNAPESAATILALSAAEAPQGPPQLQPVSSPSARHRGMQQGSKRERAFNVIKKILVERGAPVHRSEFLDALIEADLLDDTRTPGGSLSGMLTHYKNYGLITTDNHGVWSLVSLDQHPLQPSYNKTKTVER